MKKKTPSLSSSELELMKVLWNLRSATLGEIYDAVSEEKEWSYSTVKTLLSRLVQKGHVKSDPGRYARKYKACVSRNVAAKRLITELLDPLLGGSYGPLLSYLSTTDQFTDEEIEELRRILGKRPEGGQQ
jgi:predicted transcriptional regulator